MDTATAKKGREREVGPLDEKDAETVKAAQRLLETALDHSRAAEITVLANDEPEAKVVIPPAALRAVARVLQLMGERKPFSFVPREMQLSTQEAATMLNVSRPHLIKQIEGGEVNCTMVGSHRRIAYEEVVRYRDKIRADQEDALQTLADEAQRLKLGYE